MNCGLLVATILVVVIFVGACVCAAYMFCRPAQIALRRELRGEIPTSVYPIDLKRVPPPSLPQRKIPKQIFRTWEDDSWKTKCRKAYDQTAKIVPDWPQKVFTNQECDAFVHKVYADYPDIIDAYELCNYGVMKADFWRYLVIYHYGGLYLDMKSAVIKPIDLELNVDKAYVSTWDPVHHKYLFGGKGEYAQWWLMAAPNCHFLWQLIQQVTRNLLFLRHNEEYEAQFTDLGFNKSTKHKILGTTGPFVYTYIAFKHPHLVTDVSLSFDALKYILDGSEYKSSQRKHYSKKTKPLIKEEVRVAHLKRGLNSSVIPIPTIYINLERSKDRRKHMETWLNKYNVQYSRLDATDARKYRPMHTKIMWAKANVDGRIVHHRRRLTNNEVACSVSHLRAIEQSVKDNNEFTLILEDDTSFEFVQYWPKDVFTMLLTTLPRDAGILQLAWFLHDKPRCRPASAIGITNYTRHCYSTMAYVITRKGALDILKQTKVANNEYRVSHVADVLVYIKTKVYKSGMPLLMPDEWNFASTINQQRLESAQVEGAYKKRHHAELLKKFMKL